MPVLFHPALAKANALHALEREVPAPEPDPRIALRLASRTDAPALLKLAKLDSALAAAAELPGRARDGDVLVATLDGRLVAALALSDGLAVSDPFQRSGRLLALLRQRRREVARAERRRRPRLPMLRPRHS